MSLAADCPNYNTGGTSAATATFLSTFPRTIYASIQPSETGQYFKVRLAPGGRIRVTGTAQASSYYGANLWARLYRSDGTLASTLIGAIACYGTCNYTSAWYTNTSSTALEFTLRVGAQTWMLWDVVMTIEADERPRLTLFLDTNGHFSVSSPQSDHAGYLPGAAVGTGASVILPQPLSLIAAYVNSAGAIVAPPYGVTSVGFALEETSAFKGIAMKRRRCRRRLVDRRHHCDVRRRQYCASSADVQRLRRVHSRSCYGRDGCA